MMICILWDEVVDGWDFVGIAERKVEKACLEEYIL